MLNYKLYQIKMRKIILSLLVTLVMNIIVTTYSFAQPGCLGSCKTACSSGESSIPGRCAGGDVCCIINSAPIISNPSSGADPTCNSGNGIDTAIGCIPINDTNTFVSWILGWAIGVGGGIAFLLIIYGSFMIMTSQGMPDRLKIGKEILTSAISGLIMLIFGIFILNFIGFDILGLDLL